MGKLGVHAIPGGTVRRAARATLFAALRDADLDLDTLLDCLDSQDCEGVFRERV